MPSYSLRLRSCSARAPTARWMARRSLRRGRRDRRCRLGGQATQGPAKGPALTVLGSTGGAGLLGLVERAPVSGLVTAAAEVQAVEEVVAVAEGAEVDDRLVSAMADMEATPVTLVAAAAVLADMVATLVVLAAAAAILLDTAAMAAIVLVVILGKQAATEIVVDMVGRLAAGMVMQAGASVADSAAECHSTRTVAVRTEAARRCLWPCKDAVSRAINHISS